MIIIPFTCPTSYLNPEAIIILFHKFSKPDEVPEGTFLTFLVRSSKKQFFMWERQYHALPYWHKQNIFDFKKINKNVKNRTGWDLNWDFQFYMVKLILPAETNQTCITIWIILFFYFVKKTKINCFDDTTWTLGHLWILSLFFLGGKGIEKKKFLSTLFNNLISIISSFTF